MPTVAANDLDMHYTVEGAGPPLVLLHGASSSAVEDWAAQRPAFRAGFKLYLVDARGHAGTRWDAADGWSRDLLVEDLLAFVDAMGLATVHVAGFSMGAMTALTFATRHPERLRTAVVAGIDVEREPRAGVAARLMDPDRIERDEPTWARQLEKRHAAVQGPGAWQRLMRAMAADVASQPLLTPKELRQARLPILLAYGDRDVFVPAEHAVKLHRQLPDSRLLIVPNSRHVVIASQPSIFNASAVSFWRSTEWVARARAGGLAGTVTLAGEPSVPAEVALRSGDAAVELEPRVAEAEAWR
jgi:non-heme chloroperoxidase